MTKSAFLALTVLVAAALLCGHADAAYGIDISQEICASMSLSNWQCLHNEGYAFAVIQGYQGGNHVNQALARCVSEARQAGFQYVDTYIWASPYCGQGSGAADMSSLASYINANHVDVGMVWIDVESAGGCMADTGTNANFYKDIAGTLRGMGWNYGWYSSPYEWSSTVGNVDLDSSRPLWGATYSYRCNFADVHLFGGWSKVSIMQYSDRGNSCGIQFDLNCY